MNYERSASLHSRYNPQGEADRYINSLALSIDQSVQFFILIEPGLKFMVSPLKKKFPDAAIIALHAETPAALNKELCIIPPDASWYPETGISVQDFLEQKIPDIEAARIRIIEWRPALAVYKNVYLSLVEETAAFIKRSDANARTIAAFGKRWIKNFFKNIRLVTTILRPCIISKPILVTGAGPSLEDVLPVIKKASGEGSVFVVAVSSSVAALKAAGIEADMLITTDGGHWASFHLFEYFYRTHSAEQLPKKPLPSLAASLTALLPSQCGDVPILPISDGSLWQTLILKSLEIPFLTLPQRGTVTAAAVDLSFTLTEDVIYLAGLDLANNDIHTHARPYSLDRFIEKNDMRANPAYSQSFKRSSLLKTGGSYGIYAAWFKTHIAKQAELYPNRLYSIGNNHKVFIDLQTTEIKKTSTIKYDTSAPSFATINIAHNEHTLEKALSALQTALKDTALKPILEKELSPMLFGYGMQQSDDSVDIMKALYNLTGAEGKSGG